MSTSVWRSGLAAALIAGLMGSSPEVQAQFNFNPNMNPAFVSGLTQSQYMAFLQQQAAARSAIQTQAIVNPGLGGVNPYTPLTTNPYAAGGMVNPYSPMASSFSPYDSSFSNPYWPVYNDAGSSLRGAADVMRAYGTVITSQEQSRILREQAKQAALETRRRKFDLDMYIKANTPTFTEEQAKIAKMTLKRIQSNSTEPEILNGTALNLLLDDVRRHPGKKAAIEPYALSEDILGHLNVTKGNFSLGVLRNGGEFTWPIVFQEYFDANQLKLIGDQAKSLVRNTDKGKQVDVNILKDMRTELDRLSEQLFNKINEIPPTQYLEAKRFLKDFTDARIALERGEGLAQANFQKWATGGKNLQNLVDYMIANGLRFTGATQGDEGAYRSVYSGMVAFDVALNSQAGIPVAEATEPKETP
jgi:hypothetical protein